MWLSRTRSTLDQCGVHADAVLHFTPMHKMLRVQVINLLSEQKKLSWIGFFLFHFALEFNGFLKLLLGNFIYVSS